MKIPILNMFILLAVFCLFADVTTSDYKDYLEGKAPADWSVYPTYGAYVGFLEKWERDFPDICKVYTLGPGGVDSLNHHIYAVRVSKNVHIAEGEARYLETNTIHGDELLNYLNCLHMIDTLLNSYGKGDARIDSLINNIDFWFIPNSNPDGSYPKGDSTWQYAQRYNVADRFDLNRNWPCPCGEGNHQYYGMYDKRAKEIEAILNLRKNYYFNLVADMHAGTEAVIWCYGAFPERSGEEDWYKWASKRYVDRVQADYAASGGNPGYMTSCGDGLAHCFSELFECHGLPLDYGNWFGHGKQLYFEIEIPRSVPLKPRIPFWEWNREAMFQYYELLFTGIQGIVTDSITGKPVLNVKMNRNKGNINHPQDEFERFCAYTDSGGFYLRHTVKGTWDLTFSRDDYITKTVSNITLDDYEEKIKLDVQLVPKGVSIKKPVNGPCLSVNSLKNIKSIEIYDLMGRKVKTLPANANWKMRSGVYIVRYIGEGFVNKKILYLR
jgi:hypothetical protein